MPVWVERLYGAGADGLYVCGQTGEGMQQPVSQRRRVTEAAVRCSPAGKNVIVHVGAARQDEAAELARHAAEAGAHAVSSLPPGAGYSYQDVRRYYESLAGTLASLYVCFGREWFGLEKSLSFLWVVPGSFLCGLLGAACWTCVSPRFGGNPPEPARS